MARLSLMPKPLPLLGLLVATFFQLSACRDMIYCSGINTSGMPGNSSIYQSNGLCYDFCAGRYSFAILQLDECFCSNFAPVDSGDVGDCDFNCNGYPSDRCGGDELFGYFELRKRPSGTKDADGNLVTSTTTSSSSETTEPSIVTSTELVETTVYTPSTSTSSSSSSSSTSSTTTTTPSSSSTSSSTSTSKSTSEPAFTPGPFTQTISGEIRVVTMTPPANSEREKDDGGGGFGTGAAVGLSIGLVALAVLIGLAIFFLIRRKRKQREENEKLASNSSPDMGATTPARTLSESSRYMLGSDGRTVVGGWDGMQVPGNRQSRLMPVDPRLDPFAPVYQRGDGSASRESVHTVQDHHDYSRRVMPQQGLRVLNP